MTREDLTSLVQETFIKFSNKESLDFRLTTLQQLAYFAHLVAAAEREACAEYCERAAKRLHGMKMMQDYRRAAEKCAEGIRAREEQERE